MPENDLGKSRQGFDSFLVFRGFSYLKLKTNSTLLFKKCFRAVVEAKVPSCDIIVFGLVQALGFFHQLLYFPPYTFFFFKSIKELHVFLLRMSSETWRCNCAAKGKMGLTNKGKSFIMLK